MNSFDNDQDIEFLADEDVYLMDDQGFGDDYEEWFLSAEEEEQIEPQYLA